MYIYLCPSCNILHACSTGYEPGLRPPLLLHPNCQECPILLTYSSAPAELELATVKPVTGYLGIYGVFGVHGVHGELTRPPFVAHPSTQDIKTARGLRHGTKHHRPCAQTMIKGCLVGFLGDSHRDVTGLGYYISCCSNALYFPRFIILGFSKVTTQEPFDDRAPLVPLSTLLLSYLLAGTSRRTKT